MLIWIILIFLFPSVTYAQIGLPSGNVTWSYSFQFKNKTYHLKTDLPQVQKTQCDTEVMQWQIQNRKYKSAAKRKQNVFVTDYPCSFVAENIAGILLNLSEDFSDEDRINFAIAFVNSFGYREDRNKKGKKFDYWMTPYEFLRDGYGDCEDHAILLSNLYSFLDYDSLLVQMRSEYHGEDGHVTVCVKPNSDGLLYETRPTQHLFGPPNPKYKGYYWCEAVSRADGSSWKMGQKPKFFDHQILYRPYKIPAQVTIDKP